MISDSQTRYGSRVPCHGRSWRPCARLPRDQARGERTRDAAVRPELERAPSRCFAFAAASDFGYFAISSSSVRRAAGVVAQLDCAVAMLSIASGTFALSGYAAISCRCAAIDAR